MNKDGSGVEVLKNFSWVSATVPYTAAAQLNAGDGILPVSATTRYDGAHPYGFVTEGADGKVYGTCVRGGTFDHGVVWRMNKDGSNFEIIYACDSRFQYTRPNGLGVPIVTGSYGITIPWGNVGQDQLGRIYLTGYNGGQENYGGLGRMNADGSNVQILMSGGTANGAHSYRGPLIIDNEVFGTFRIAGGGTSTGVVWKYNILTDAYTKLKTFESTGGYQDGYDIWAGLAYDGTNLFGTAIAGGGPGNIGTLWKVKPDGTDFEVIHRFSNTPGGECGVGSASLFSYYPSAERVTFANVTQDCSKTCIEVPLTVRFIKFEVSVKNERANLEWATAAEQNNQGFEIERSTDGSNWQKVGFVSGKSANGNSDIEQYYTFSDSNPLSGKNMYRLKQIDFDGKHEYSSVRTLWLESKSKVNIYPNPAKDNVHITGLQENDEVFLYDVLGRLLHHQKALGLGLSISLENYAPGTYNIRIKGANGAASYKLIKGN